MRGYMRESRTKKVPIIRYDYDDKDDMFDAHSYNKGGRILHMLRSLLGDEAFFESLNKYLTNNEYSDAEAHSLRLACEQVTGLDLNWFFNQWFFEAGHPELDIRYEYVDSLREQRIIVEQTQDLSSSILFKFPVKVDMYASGDLTSQEYFIEERIDTLKISSSSKPSFVNFDVEKVLLCSKNDVKPDSWWERQYESAAHYVARYDALARATEEGAVIPSIIVDALNDASWHMREMALEAVPLLDSAKLTSLENQVVTMTKDERSNVRATALIALAIEFDGSKHKKLFIDGLNDRSYMVIAYSLQALSMVDYQQASKEAKALELEESSEIIYAISEMYAENGDQSKNQFFVDKIAIASPDDRYSLVQNYAVFLSNQETSMMADNLGTIVEIARNGEPWWIKYSAYQGFMILLGDVDAQKEQIEAELSEMEVPDIQLQNVLDNLASRRNIIQTTFEDCIATETDRRILNSFGGATE
jgi:aminopeptidase N